MDNIELARAPNLRPVGSVRKTRRRVYAAVLQKRFDIKQERKKKTAPQKIDRMRLSGQCLLSFFLPSDIENHTAADLLVCGGLY